MRGMERFLVLGAIAYMAVYLVLIAVYIPYPLALSLPPAGVNQRMSWIVPLHFFGILLNFGALVLTIRDLYLRTFPKENYKLTWLLLILLTGGIGWLVYIFKHAQKAR